MPTGYTSDIEKGISFNKFIMNCAGAFGACVEMRDDSQDVPIPKEFKPSTYHAEELERSRTALKEMKKMPVSVASKKAIAERDKEVKRLKDSIVNYRILKKKYDHMREKVIAWKPPTDGHSPLRDFMKEQIDNSIQYDCNESYVEEKLKYRQSSYPESGDVWKKRRLDDIKEDIKRHRKEYALEVERVNTNNKWVQDLRDSLKKEKV